MNKEDTDTSDSESVAGKSLEVQESLGLPIRVPQYLRTFILPSGFPGKVISNPVAVVNADCLQYAEGSAHEFHVKCF